MKIRIFDNGGKTADRFTAVLDDHVYTLSPDCNETGGINKYMGQVGREVEGLEKWAGKHIATYELPIEVQKAIALRVEAL